VVEEAAVREGFISLDAANLVQCGETQLSIYHLVINRQARPSFYTDYTTIMPSLARTVFFVLSNTFVSPLFILLFCLYIIGIGCLPFSSSSSSPSSLPSSFSSPYSSSASFLSSAISHNSIRPFKWLDCITSTTILE